MRNVTGINLNAQYGNGVTRYGQKPEQRPFSNPDVFRPSTPDVYRPSNPHIPGILPSYPDKPLWMPPVPSGPIIEVPNDMPMELPPFPGHKDWATPPKPPAELPDWSQMPKHFPHPEGPEIQLPTPKTFPDGTWLLS